MKLFKTFFYVCLVLMSSSIVQAESVKDSCTNPGQFSLLGLSEAEQKLVGDQVKSCIIKAGVESEEANNIFLSYNLEVQKLENYKAQVKSSKGPLSSRDIHDARKFNAIYNNKKVCDTSLHSSDLKIIPMNYVGSGEPRKANGFSKRAEHLHSATGIVQGLAHDLSRGLTHTAVLCGDTQHLCGISHTFCDNVGIKPDLDVYTFFQNFDDLSDPGIKIDVSKSWFGKFKDKNKNGVYDNDDQKIYGECLVGADIHTPVVLRLKTDAKHTYPGIRPVQVKPVDTSKMKILNTDSLEVVTEKLRYAKKISEGFVAVGYHEDSATNTDLKYVQDSGLKFVVKRPSDAIYKVKNFPMKESRLLQTTGYFTPRSSGSPNATCKEANGRSECSLQAITAGFFVDCLPFGSVSEVNRHCLNISAALDSNFSRALAEEIKK